MNHCLIPAKENSKRIPGKNFREFLGVPIWYRAYKTAVDSGVFDQIDIMSDSRNFIEGHYIEAITGSSNINVIPENAEMTDSRTLSDVVTDYIRERKLTEGRIGILLPTSVFVSYDLIRQMLYYAATNLDQTLAVGKKIDKKALNCFIKDKRLTNQYKNKVSQDIPQPFIDAGQFYVVDINKFIKDPILLGEKVNFFELDTDSIDIDEPEDWEKAEALYTNVFLEN